jgi:hypothetical protein
MQTGQLTDFIVIKQTVLFLDNKGKDISPPLMSEIFLGKVFSEPMRLLVSKVNRMSNDKLMFLKQNTFIQAFAKK